jgi:hypothetical protein
MEFVEQEKLHELLYSVMVGKIDLLYFEGREEEKTNLSYFIMIE